MNESVAEAILNTPGCFNTRSSKPSITSERRLVPYYVNPRIINSYPKQRDVIFDEMFELIDRSGEIGGTFLNKLVTTVDGLPICSFVGDEIGVGIAYLPKFKEPGTRKQIEGHIENGENVVGVNDLVIDGAYDARVINAVKDSGANINDYCTVFNMNHGATKLLSSLDVKLHALAELSTDFIDTALRKGKITTTEYESFKEYAKSPVEWSKNYILRKPEYIKTRLAEYVENGKIRKMAPLEILTIGHPELKEKYEPLVQEWLADLDVSQDVPQFNYKILKP